MPISAIVRHASRPLFLSLLLISGMAAAQAPEQSDVRVLIDISGSMHQNDPKNLRRPALRMLSGLLQPGTRAGVWTFARWVNNLVPVGEVDQAWKKRTQSLSKQISSPGQFTNIEEVLDQASRDWEGKPTQFARHLVLLTDGMVDVSKKAGENERSRERILDELLPRMKAAGVKVHTIALSARADHELMERLAGETGGWYQQVEQADELQRVFLRMFEKVGNPDTVPLQDNKFVVDGAVDEATVLAFSKAGSPPVVLRSPSGKTYQDSDLVAGVAWFRDQGYDMITISSPEKGEWSLQADLDPDNRVMIVTDLQLRTSEVPTHIAVGEQTPIEASLNARDKLVTRKAFLRLLEVRADAVTENGTDPQGLNDAGQAGDDKASDGRYTMTYVENHAQPEVELVVSVDSPTFMREKRFRLVVHEPAQIAVESGDDGPLLNVTLQGAVLQAGAELSAWQEDASGQRLPLELGAGDGDKRTASLVDPVAPTYLKVSGKTRLGNLLERTIGPVMPPGVVAPPEPEPLPAPVPEPAAEAAAAEAEAEAPSPVQEPEPEPVTEEESWVMPAILFGGFNLALLIGAGVWFFLRRRRGDDESLDLDDLLEGEDEPTVEDSTDIAEPAKEDAA